MAQREVSRSLQPEALDKRSIKVLNPKTRVEEVVPELHPSQVEDVQFLLYTAPPVDHVVQQAKQNHSNSANRAVLEEWMERAGLIFEDLQWLLCLPHSKFWSQVIFDQSLQQCLDSYLRSAPRHFDGWSGLPPDVTELQQGIHRCIFMTFLRMSTFKESSIDFLTPETFGEIIYENYLFDIPKLMDICALFGGEEDGRNTALLSKMLQNLFTQQPKYHNDLDDTIPTVYESLENVLTRCGIHNEDYSRSPQQLSAALEDVNLSIQELSDIVLYLFDTAHTLLSFLMTFPPACVTFHRQGFVARLASYYETLAPFLDEKLLLARADILLKQHWKCSKALLLRTCNVVLESSCINQLMNSGGTTKTETLQACVEDYLQVVTDSLLSEKRFLSAYNARFSIEQDLDIIQSSRVAVDGERVRYILSAVDSAEHTYPSNLGRKKRHNKPSKPASNKNTARHCPVEPRPMINGDLDEDHLQGAGLPTELVSDVELDSMLSHIKDLLPDLGEGFIVKCLDEFAYDVERVISSILEDNLPEPLKCLDRTLTKDQVRKPVKQHETVLEQRHSIFDQDEFDVFSSKTVDTSKIHKGKKRDKLSLKSLMTDRSYITSSVRTRFSRYDVFGGIDEYDDEYDDTYDSQNVGALDADSADELTARRPFTIPRVLGGSPVESSESEESEDGDEDTSARPNTNVEAAQQGKQGQRDNTEAAWGRQPTGQQNSSQKRGDNRGNKPRHGGQQGKKSGERGDQYNRGNKPQRSGQQGERGGGKDDAKVLRDRAYKEKNKSRRANHNRKAGADRKRRGGMGPLPPGM